MKTLELYQNQTGNEIHEGAVVELDDYRPHVRISTPRAEHVIPDEVFHKIVSGEMEIDEVDDWKPIMRTIIKEWLDNLPFRG
jgi:hypothetical protein